MKVLYLTNIPNPYRERFFEQLGQRCELTVLYERESASNRDASWAEVAEASTFTREFLNGHEVGNENSFSFKILSRLKGHDLVVVGCYNSPVEMLATLYMRASGIPYAINSDGPIYPLSGVKGFVRKFVLEKATGYLVAGSSSVESVRSIVGNGADIQPYPFSSLIAEEVAAAARMPSQRERNRVLCVGQFEDYKGVDVLVNAAALLPAELEFRLVGAGKRADELEELVKAKGLANVVVIPFLPKDELQSEYLRAGMLVLPSRRECWGLVVNEASACGTPIVSTWGAGAAVEFLGESHPQLLVQPSDSNSLADAIKACAALSPAAREAYSEYLRKKSSGYTVEAMVEAHMELFERLVEEGAA